MDFVINDHNLYILDDSGIVYKSDKQINSEYNQFNCNFSQFFDDVIMLESNPYYTNPVFAIRSDRTAWAWAGNNYHGTYGNDSYTNSPFPIQSNISNVIDIKVNNDLAFFLTENENLYVTGGYYMYNTPYLFETGVKAIIKSDSLYYVTSDSLNYVNSYLDIDRCDEKYSDKQIVLNNGNLGYYIQNGELFVRCRYNRTDGILGLGEDVISTNNEYVRVESIENAVNVFSNNTTTYIQTEDGTLYGMGVNSGGQLADFSTANSFVPKKIHFGLQPNYDSLEVNRTNITDDTLSDQVLVVEFNEALIKGNNYAYISMIDENGNQVGINKSITLNKFIISKANGFEINKAYTLNIPNDALMTLFSNGNEEISFTFSYMNNSNPEPEEDLPSIWNEELLTEEIETVETFINEEVQRFYWTEELILDKIDFFAKHGVNSYFYNNAIINNFSVDIPENYWLRIQGPSSSTYNELSIAYNYWGTTNEILINKQIVDFNDYQTLTNLNPDPWLTEAPSDVWPFVVNAGVMNSEGEVVDTVGNESVTFFTEFNRPMDREVDLDFRFGSTYPYADYQITGEWVSDTRWEGNATINTRIESGAQYLSISNAYSGDEQHLQFFKDWGRFTFNIDMSNALSMTMHGEAMDTGIQLTWEQDDFDTLIGYNVYRSYSEDGFYTRLNSVVIPVGEEEFFDDTVEPGQVYYYNFTVVMSDLSESTPSGKIVIRSKDTMAPNIYHSPVYTAYTGSNLVISATIIDNIGVQRAKLYYRITETEEWHSVEMTKNNDKYYGTIPSSYVTTAGIDYYIEAFDGVSYTYSRTAENPYNILVKEAIGNDQLGDVDGDGKITNKDALMIIQAVNDLLNLTEDEFTRADLNKDGELSSTEALLILKYVSGKITSLVI